MRVKLEDAESALSSKRSAKLEEKNAALNGPDMLDLQSN